MLFWVGGGGWVGVVSGVGVGVFGIGCCGVCFRFVVGVGVVGGVGVVVVVGGE